MAETLLNRIFISDLSKIIKSYNIITFEEIMDALTDIQKSFLDQKKSPRCVYNRDNECHKKCSRKQCERFLFWSNIMRNLRHLYYIPVFKVSQDIINKSRFDKLPTTGWMIVPNVMTIVEYKKGVMIYVCRRGKVFSLSVNLSEFLLINQKN